MAAGASSRRRHAPVRSKPHPIRPAAVANASAPAPAVRATSAPRLVSIANAPRPRKYHPGEMHRYNCFAYALDIDPSDARIFRRRGTFLQILHLDAIVRMHAHVPHTAALQRVCGYMWRQMCRMAELKTTSGVVRIVRAKKPTAITKPFVDLGITPAYYRIAMLVSLGRDGGTPDFHVMREYCTADGQVGWTHKPGMTAPVEHDSDFQPIECPRKAALRGGLRVDGGKYEFCSFAYVLDRRTRRLLGEKLGIPRTNDALTAALELRAMAPTGAGERADAAALHDERSVSQ